MSTDAGRHNEMVLALEAVINALHDSQKCLADIGDRLRDESLKRYFLAESLKRASFRGDLEEFLHQSGVHDISENGTATGMVYRVWGDLKAKLGGRDDALLAAAEKTEEEVKAAYADALGRELPHTLRETLANHQAHVFASHEFLHSHRDAVTAK